MAALIVGAWSISKLIPSVLRASLRCEILVRYVSVDVTMSLGSEKSILESCLLKAFKTIDFFYEHGDTERFKKEVWSLFSNEEED